MRTKETFNSMEGNKYVPLDDVVAIINRYRSYYDNNIPNVNYKMIMNALTNLEIIEL